ncbi:MAG: hypothetical protein CXB60_10265 [Spiroplasma poulsonii]|nr:hypothetical protein [Spiroplasma poulsonii]
MKKILSLLGTITLIGTNTTSLVSCNTPQEYTSEELAKLKEEKNIKIKISDDKYGILEWIAPQEKPFNSGEIINIMYYMKRCKKDNWTIKNIKI